MKEILKRVALKSGIYVASVERLGIDVDLDLQRLTSGNPVRVIFDVGANLGQSALRFSSAYTAADIYSFEPVPATYATLQEAVKLQSRVKIFNMAMGAEPGTARINLTESSGSNSIVAISSATDSVEVRVETVDHFAEAHEISKIDLLKIDVEGFELEVLKGAAGCLRKGAIRFIFAECTLAKDEDSPHTSFFDLHKVLEANGFCFVAYYAESFSLKSGCAMGNVLYALKDQLPSSVPGTTKNIA